MVGSIILLTIQFIQPGDDMRINTRKKKLTMLQQEAFMGWLFILPFAIGLLIFQVLPILSSAVISMTDLRYINKLDQASYIGFRNFVNSFNDKMVRESILRTLYYMFLYSPSVTIVGLLLAIMVNGRIFFKKFIRIGIFMPYISNFSAIALVWKLLLDYRDGPINSFLRSIGFENPPLWLLGVKTVIPTIVIINVWVSAGFAMMIFLGALQNVPEELHEAAKIDGAGAFRRLINVTVPLISPTIFFVTVTNVIAGIKNFSSIQVLTQGGPGDASYTLAINIYNEAFTKYRMGYSTAQGIIMLGIILIITVIQMHLQKRWVHYS